MKSECDVFAYRPERDLNLVFDTLFCFSLNSQVCKYVSMWYVCVCICMGKCIRVSVHRHTSMSASVHTRTCVCKILGGFTLLIGSWKLMWVGACMCGRVVWVAMYGQGVQKFWMHYLSLSYKNYEHYLSFRMTSCCWKGDLQCTEAFQVCTNR